MKTFLLNIPQRLKLKSQEMDAQAALCDKPWTVFNDEGIKQLFIFQPDGTLLISTNGVVSNSTWRFISANKSIIITTDNTSIMFHPAFLDDVVFALQQDGEGSCLFMIDERNQESFSPKCLAELDAYFTRQVQLLKDKETFQHHTDNQIKEEQHFDNKKQTRETIKDQYATEIQIVREEAERQKKKEYLGVIGFSLGILIIALRGFVDSRNAAVLIISVGLFFVLVGIIVWIECAKADPDVAEKRFIDSKLSEKGQ